MGDHNLKLVFLMAFFTYTNKKITMFITYRTFNLQCVTKIHMITLIKRTE